MVQAGLSEGAIIAFRIFTSRIQENRLSFKWICGKLAWDNWIENRENHELLQSFGRTALEQSRGTEEGLPGAS